MGVVRKRRRQNQKVLVGNNKTGRRGKLRCEACRRVRGQCEYTSTSAPCLYCQGKNFPNCIKQWGPKRQQRLRAPEPRTMPATDTEIISAQSMPILHWLHGGNVLGVTLAHSDGKCNEVIINAAQFHILGFMKSLLPIYSPALTSPSLRSALFVFGGIVVSGGTFATREMENLQTGLTALRHNLASDSVGEADLFASFLLAFSSWARPDQQPEAYRIHLKGFRNILKRFSENPGQQQFHLKKFWPMARDLLLSVPYFRMPGCTDSIWFGLYHDCSEAIGPPTLAQCLEYRNDQWAIYDHLHYHQRILARAFMARIAERRDEVSASIELALGNIRADLDSAERHLGALLEASAHEIPTDYSLGTRMEFRICKFYLTMLEKSDSPTHQNISQVFGMAELKTVALKVIDVLSSVATFNLETKGIWSLSFSDTCDQMSMWALSLATLSLCHEELHHCLLAGVPIRSLLQWFFGEAIINTLTEFYDEASMTHLRATVNYWFTFREPSVDTQQVPTCLGCTRRANLVHELTGASFIKFDRPPVLDS